MLRVIGIVLACGCAVTSAVAPRSLLGTWCVEDGDLVISFRKGDSLLVAGEGANGINGIGTYLAHDTLFAATVVNGDVTVELGYRYKWESDSVITAQPRFLMVNKDSVDHPTEWMRMRRCAKRVVTTAAPPVKEPARSRAASDTSVKQRAAPTPAGETGKQR